VLHRCLNDEIKMCITAVSSRKWARI